MEWHMCDLSQNREAHYFKSQNSHKLRLDGPLCSYADLTTYFPNTINILKQLFWNWIPDILF